MNRGLIARALFIACCMPQVAEAAEAYCEGNAAVIYCNDFESGGLDGLEAGEAATVVSATDGAPVYDGEYALHADFTPPYNAQAEFGYRFTGVERVYARFYVRFDAIWDEPMHHWFALHGDAADNMWSCHGDAGCRPNGEICLSGTTVDTREQVEGEAPGEPFFYTYHPQMSCDPGDSCSNYADPQAICDGCAERGLPCENGLECCWGNWFDINQGVAISMVQDTWYEIETMVAANTPGQPDGEMALWVDGELVAEHSGIAWRNHDALLLNHLIVWNYYPALQSARSVWYDNLVISTEPIGGTDGGGDTGDDGATTMDPDPTADDDGGPTGLGESSALGEAGVGSGATATVGTADTDTDTDAAGGAESSGCSCRQTGNTGIFPLLFVVLGLRVRRASVTGRGGFRRTPAPE